MSIIIIYLIGCFLSYMRVNAFEHSYGGGIKNTLFIVLVSLFSWAGFIGGVGIFYMNKQQNIHKQQTEEKFFKI